MRTSKTLILALSVLALAFVPAVAAGQSSNTGTDPVSPRAILVDLGPGTGPPPATLGGFPMTAIPFPGAPACTLIQPPLPTPGGTVGIAPTDAAGRCIGAGWGTWSHGYTGDVYYTGGATSQTITLPPGTQAFYFYVEPNPFAVHTFEAIAQPGGVSTGIFSADGSGGATYVGFFTDDGSDITSITVNSSVDFAIGELGWAGGGGPASLTGDIGGASGAVAICRNLSTGTTVPVPLGGGTSVDCTAAGLGTSPGDIVLVGIIGIKN